MNLFTNVLFVLSAFFAWKILSASSVTHKRYLQLLIILIGLIGVGSFIFHGTPNQFTILLDAIPIYIFVAMSLVFLLHSLINSWQYASGIVAAFAGLLVTVSLVLPSDFLNGSIRHILILAAVIGLLLLVYRKYGRIALDLAPVIGLYVVAIVARSIDQYVCSAFPLGTHFLWHSLDALASYFVVVFLVKLSDRSN